jgi:hypothetical protein
MRQWLRRLFSTPGRYYFWGSAAILLVAVQLISSQLADRAGFANGSLREDVMARWGAPISQSGPSIRFVESGSVFSTLEPLALDRQRVFLDADMSYRKRGLVYFSGFEFALRGEYAATNPRSRDIDVVFVFPIEQARRSMLRDLRFRVNGEPAELPLSESADKLVWTGRLAAGESATFEIGLRGRGLDSRSTSAAAGTTTTRPAWFRRPRSSRRGRASACTGPSTPSRRASHSASSCPARSRSIA